ncbi:leucine-rich repeat domain-containing protein [Limnothrix sp. FACHB-1083]|uniref:leucine-rich repeat domain-containing protein n=1 Tax=unclassified Limnothrix TaxID=2632864 RepID=UPI001680FFA9|nr:MULTISPECIES: leucine-rich repeat domain-containing protein [unclassified Limnothrix]MBD2159465.1 leucine-rich repeat domain-containing protein [Limnothrix sp. FACHB-1083]MBD2190167.1 leucine-rich repeat domain-containing protein [Limnothrix sp. FACHB-1088]
MSLEVAQQRIAAALAEGETSLDLSELGLTELPIELFALTHLEELWLYNNQLTSIPEAIAQLQNLQTLWLSNNQLTSLPESIAQLQNLQELRLGDNQLTSIPEAIAQLQNLQTLSLNNNQLTSIPEAIAQLQNLQTLSLNNNQLTSIPEAIAQLQNLQEIDLDRNQLTSIPEAIAQLQNLKILSLDNNQLTSAPEAITQLQNLKILYLSDNQLTSFPEAITQLQKLQILLLNNNQLTSIPEVIAQLQSLQILTLANNQLTSFPEAIAQLQNLKILWLNNNQLTSIPEWIDQLSRLQAEPSENWQKQLSNLNLQGNQIQEIPLKLVPFLKGVYNVAIDQNPYSAYPPEIVEQGQQAIFDYLDERIEGYEQKWVSKLLVVGQGGTGKTALLNALRGQAFVPTDTTHGMAIAPLELAHPTRADVTMTLNAWDFGGQEIYHATHQFFMSERSLFVVVWSARSGHEEGKLDYWLNTITTLAPNAPIVLVASHTDQHAAAFPDRAFREKYPQIQAIARVSNRTNDGIDDLRTTLAQLAAELPLMGETWPATWLRAADSLAELPDPYIGPKAFYRHLAAAGVAETSRPVLARWLHELGQILFFQDRPANSDLDLSDLVILQPAWASQTISRVIDDREVEEKRGIFTHCCMERLWCDLDRHVCDHLLRLMERFDLSYRLLDDRDADRSLVVERVPHNPPPYETDWDALADGPQIAFRYHLNFVPPGIPTWFIARQSRFSIDRHWRYGALFAYDDGGVRHLALLDLPLGERSLRLTVRGPHPQNFCTLLHDGITQLLAERFPGLQVTPKVLCPGHDGQPCTHEFDYQQLRTRKKPLIECPSAEEDLVVDRLLYGIDRRTEQQVLQRIESLTETVLKNQAETRSELQSLREQTSREFTKQFAADQSKVDRCCPTIFTIQPCSGGDRFSSLKQAVLGQKLELQLYCEHPGCCHPVEQCRYELTDGARWLKSLSPHLNKLVTLLKVVAPLAGPTAGLTAAIDNERWKAGLEFTKELAGQLPHLSIADLDPDLAEGDRGRFDRLAEEPIAADDRQLWALRQFLKDREPDFERSGLGKGELQLVLTPEYHYLWLCPEHREPYRGRETYPHATFNPFSLDETSERAIGL